LSFRNLKRAYHEKRRLRSARNFPLKNDELQRTPANRGYRSTLLVQIVGGEEGRSRKVDPSEEEWRENGRPFC